MNPPKTRQQMRKEVISRLMELHSLLEVMLYDLDEVLDRVKAEKSTSTVIYPLEDKK